MLYFFPILIATALLDQASKLWVVKSFALYESVTVIPGFFSLTYLHNTGAAFGMFAGQPGLFRQVFFIGIALVALVLLFFFQRRFAKESRWFTVSFALIAGGAIGNLIDRLRYGSVVDFLDFYIGTHHWPAFNIADSAICVGVALFVLLSFLQDRLEKQKTQVVQ